MSTKNDGGYAFPHSFTNETYKDCSGMTLRDYFAGQALAGGLEQGVEHDMATAVGPDRDAWWHPVNKIARRAYAIADAMLKERMK